MLGHLSVLDVITSDSAADVKVRFKWRGVADVRKPNTKRPYWRRVRIVTVKPLIYRIGNQIVCHPSLLAEIQAAFQQSAQPDAAQAPIQNDALAQWQEFAAKHLFR